MLILGLETSCDETSAAIVEDGFSIRSNIISSSLFRHKPYGGVVPEIASRHSLEQVEFVVEQALKQADVKLGDLDLVAVTHGPGLIGSLLVGVCYGKALSYRLGIPLIGVNHLEAHLSACFMVPIAPMCDDDALRGQGSLSRALAGGGRMPREFIGLLVSGGHTMITAHRGSRTEVLGETVDDAVGEAYDKTAKILGLGFPGGPIMDRLAREGNSDAVFFTKPKQKNRLGRDANHRGIPLGHDAHRFSFSYSGIKTAVLYHVQKQRAQTGWNEEKEQRLQKDVAASFQRHAISWLVEKTMDAVQFKNMKHVAVGGGVSANSYLRQRMTEETQKAGVKLWLSPLPLSGDNAAMIACRGFQIFKSRKQKFPLSLTANPSLKIVASR